MIDPGQAPPTPDGAFIMFRPSAGRPVPRASGKQKEVRAGEQSHPAEGRSTILLGHIRSTYIQALKIKPHLMRLRNYQTKPHSIAVCNAVSHKGRGHIFYHLTELIYGHCAFIVIATATRWKHVVHDISSSTMKRLKMVHLHILILQFTPTIGTVSICFVVYFQPF